MAPAKQPDGIKIITENRRARMRYDFDKFIEVGIELLGSEVKSIREGKFELGDAYAHVYRGQLYLANAFIAPYPFAKTFGHEPKRERRLLAHREEIDWLDGKIRQKGLTLIAVRAYLKNGKVKIELGLGKGKAVADRREEIKERDSDREARAAMSRAPRKR